MFEITLIELHQIYNKNYAKERLLKKIFSTYLVKYCVMLVFIKNEYK
jgi:hypothetical protein